MSVGSFLPDEETTKKYPVLIPGLCAFDWGLNDTLYCLNSANLTKPVEGSSTQPEDQTRRISTVEEWNSYYNSNISKQVKGDLLVVFDSEERFNYDDVLTSFNEDVNGYLEPDFLKFICSDSSNTKKPDRKAVTEATKMNFTSAMAINTESLGVDAGNKDDSPRAVKTEVEERENPRNYPALSYKKVSDSKKDEIRQKQQELIEMVLSRKKQMQNTPFVRFRVD